MDLQDELHEDLLINIKDFTRLRAMRKTHVNDVDPSSRDDKIVLHPWPNEYAISRFHRRNEDEFTEILLRNNVDILNSDYLFIYNLPLDEVNGNGKEIKKVDFERFLHLRNFFAIKRLKYWSRNNWKVKISLSHRSKNNFDIDINPSTGDTEQLSQFMTKDSRDQLICRFTLLKDSTKYLVLHYTQFVHLFQELRLYADQNFIVERELEDADGTSFQQGYILYSDQELYKKVVERSYVNFDKLVDDPVLLSKCKQHYNRYKTNSEV